MDSAFAVLETQTWAKDVTLVLKAKYGKQPRFAIESGWTSPVDYYTADKKKEGIPLKYAGMITVSSS